MRTVRVPPTSPMAFCAKACSFSRLIDSAVAMVALLRSMLTKWGKADAATYQLGALCASNSMPRHSPCWATQQCCLARCGGVGETEDGYRAWVAALLACRDRRSQVGQPVCWAPQPARATLEDVRVDLGRADVAVGEPFLLPLPGMTALPGMTVRSGFGSPSSVRPYLVETWPLPSTRHRARHNDPLTSGAVSAPASAPAARCRPWPPAS
jgi:hypothetical protein